MPKKPKSKATQEAPQERRASQHEIAAAYRAATRARNVEARRTLFLKAQALAHADHMEMIAKAAGGEVQS